ncbi:MAG: M48 family metallopeptidase [Endomicrobium sp.]|nr:M48 family metallopeptidase [Endomicrobium sp.]
MNFYTFIVVSLLITTYLVEMASNLLNIKNISSNVPFEFQGYFDKEKYTKSQEYLKTNTKFYIVLSSFFLTLQIIFIVSHGFNYLNTVSLSFGFGTILTGLVFIGILFFAVEILKLPFSIFHIFIIEEKFGFNKLSIKNFVLDILKSWIISTIIGIVVCTTILWILINVYQSAWLFVFLFIILLNLFITLIAPIVIMPLFNKYTPLEEGELKKSIEKYAKKERFKMKGIFKMDGSKRSTKSNAFLTGFGMFRRIVLFDTLIQKHTVDELTSVLAHEMGHFRLGHIVKHIIFSLISTGIMLFIFSLLIDKVWLYSAFCMHVQPVYAGIAFLIILYSPVSLVTKVVSNYFSRRYEYQADAYSIKTHKNPEAMIIALKKLSVDNLSNLHPHRLKVILEYSHPPILKRIKAIKSLVILESVFLSKP